MFHTVILTQVFIMANKRQLKKAIRRACGAMAGECFFAQRFFGKDNETQWDQIVVNIALLQENAINRTSIDFDHVPGDFANGREYKKARRTYFKTAIKALKEYIHAETEKVVADMNALMPKKA